MLQRKVVYEGICFEANPKAAFVDDCMNDSAETREALIFSMLKFGEDSWRMNPSVDGKGVLKLEWTDEEKEKIFDKILKKGLFRKEIEEMPAVDQFHLRPLLEMDHKEIQVESLVYLVYAIVKNARCCEAMNEYLEKDNSVYESFKNSEYKDSPFLYWFCQKDKLVAKAAIGLILQMRQDKENEEKYRSFMEILYRGYKPVKNNIKKLHSFCGENFRDFILWDDDMVLNTARMVVQLVIAEDLNIPIVIDYFFYVVLQMFLVYERSFCKVDEVEITSESQKYYKKMQKECGQLESYYLYYYQSDNGYDELDEKEKVSIQNGVFAEDRQGTALERLFGQYHLNIRMFYGIDLERSEVEKIFELFGEVEQQEYEDLLLIATLCKYIDSLHQFCNEKYEQTSGFQKAQMEQELKKLLQRQNELSRKECQLDQRKSELEDMFVEKERENEKLKSAMQEMEMRHQKEREELIRLRNFVFQSDAIESCDERLEEEDEKLKEMKAEKMVIIGGHPGWQQKMKQQFPNSQFIALNSTHFDTSMVKNKKYIVVNTDMLKHGSYYRIMAEKQKEQKVCYVHGSNIERGIRELAMQV